MPTGTILFYKYPPKRRIILENLVVFEDLYRVFIGPFLDSNLCAEEMTRDPTIKDLSTWPNVLSRGILFIVTFGTRLMPRMSVSPIASIIIMG